MRAEACKNRAAAPCRPPGVVSGYFSDEQSPPTRRTELTRSFDAGCADIDPGADVVGAPVVPVVPAVELDEVSSVPVTSTFFPTFMLLSSDVVPSSAYVVPDAALRGVVAPVVPVVPAVEPVDAVPLELAFVKMKDAPFPDPDVVRDGAVPAVVVPPVVPVVLDVALMSPCCKHPVTVIVPLCAPRAAVCGELVAVCVGGCCAATSAAKPNAIANSAPAPLICASFSYVSTAGTVQIAGPCRRWRRLRLMMASRSDHVRSTD